MKKIGIITVTYNSSKVLDDFMQSILKQDYSDFILYIIDNDSKDSTLAVLSKYPSNTIKLIKNEENYGFAKGVNQGVMASIADGCSYVLLINNDTIFGSDLLSILLHDLIITNADMASPKIMYHEPNNIISSAGGGFIPWQAMKNYNIGCNEIDHDQYNQIIKCQFVPACCLLIKIELFSPGSVGIMDEKYFVYFEDADWMLRASRMNKILIYTPNVKIYHKESSLTGGVNSEFIVKIFFRNRIYYIRKNFTGIYKCYSLAYVLAVIIIKLLLNKIPRKYCKHLIKSIYQGYKL